MKHQDLLCNLQGLLKENFDICYLRFDRLLEDTRVELRRQDPEDTDPSLQPQVTSLYILFSISHLVQG